MDYKRNQVEEALWRYLGRSNSARPAPSIFNTRIKRLLELDRSGDELEALPLAFADARPGGRGQESHFSAFNSFSLGVGLLLLNAGFKQAEIVFLLRHIRPALERAWQIIEENPPVLRQRLLAKDRPGCPSFRKDDADWADTQVYLLLEKVELKELVPRHNAAEPMIYEPILCQGSENLTETFRARAIAFPCAQVIELSIMAVSLKSYLIEAAPRKRGPG
jgi:hypothetical protein